jgi:hypothetical protein
MTDGQRTIEAITLVVNGATAGLSGNGDACARAGSPGATIFDKFDDTKGLFEEDRTGALVRIVLRLATHVCGIFDASVSEQVEPS